MLKNGHSLSYQSRRPALRVRAITRPDPVISLLRTLLMLSLLLVLLQAAAVGRALAHSNLVESQPANGALLDASPERVVATFSEELDSSLSGISVFDTQGTRVDNGDGRVDLDDLDHKSLIVSLPPLPAGAYTARWNARSVEDGDDTEGAFAFTISGEATDAPESGEPTGTSNDLIIGAVGVGALLLLGAAMIYFRRRKEALA